MQEIKSNYSSIKGRIVEYIDKKGINPNRFYSISGVTRGTLSQESGISEQNILKFISSFDDVSPEWLLTGKGPMLREGAGSKDASYVVREKEAYKAHDISVPYTRINRQDAQAKPTAPPRVPIYDVEARAGSGISFFNHDSAPADPIAYLEVPDLPTCDGAVYVRGDSMEPTLKSGDIIVYKKMQEKTSLVWGHIYLLDVALDGDSLIVIKHVEKGSDSSSIRLVSQNPSHKSMEVCLDDVRSIAMVKGYLRKGTF